MKFISFRGIHPRVPAHPDRQHGGHIVHRAGINRVRSLVHSTFIVCQEHLLPEPAPRCSFLIAETAKLT